MPKTPQRQPDLAEWERVLAAAVALQRLLPEATLVGGTAAAIHAGHRRSVVADHVIEDLASRFDRVRSDLDHAAGWQVAREKRPVILMGSLDGVLTTVRNLIRQKPLETVEVETAKGKLRVPTRAEILRIKTYLAAIRRNATRDYLDVAALADGMSDAQILKALAPMDQLYPQAGDPGAVRLQLIRRLADPRPYDLDEVDLREYKGIQAPWTAWDAVVKECRRVAVLMAGAVAVRRAGWTDVKGSSKS